MWWSFCRLLPHTIYKFFSPPVLYHQYKRSIFKIKNKEYRESSLPRTIWCIYLLKKKIYIINNILRQQSADDGNDECLNYRKISTHQTFTIKKGPYICWLLLCVVSYTYIYIYIKCKNIRKTQNRNFQSNSCLEWYSMRQFKKYFSQIKCIFIQFVFFCIYSYILLVFFCFVISCLTAWLPACCMHAVCGYGWLCGYLYCIRVCMSCNAWRMVKNYNKIIVSHRRFI